MSSSAIIKLSGPAPGEFREIHVLFEDEYLLALDKPSGLLTSPDPSAPDQPSLVKLLHAGIHSSKPWARERGLAYLMNAHRLDFETSGIILLAKTKPVLVELADVFGSEKPCETCVALVQGSPESDQFEIGAKLAPHPARPGLVRVDPERGKRSRTIFEVAERFRGWTLLKCKPLTGRAHQIRAHLRHAGFPVVGDSLYGGKPLRLSSLKSGYRLKPHASERPLMNRVALHAESLTLLHPISGQTIQIHAPWPKDFNVSVKYLRRYASI